MTARSAENAPSIEIYFIVRPRVICFFPARLTDGAVAYARDLKLRMSVVVLDDGGRLISADRMDGTSFHLEHQAKGKAFTSIISRQPSAAVAGLVTNAANRFYGIINMWPGQVH